MIDRDKNTIKQILKRLENTFDKGYLVAKERGDDMNVWFRIGHDISHDVDTIKFLLDKKD